MCLEWKGFVGTAWNLSGADGIFSELQGMCWRQRDMSEADRVDRTNITMCQYGVGCGDTLVLVNWVVHYDTPVKGTTRNLSPT
jgi:hypothetical protein